MINSTIPAYDLKLIENILILQDTSKIQLIEQWKIAQSKEITFREQLLKSKIITDYIYQKSLAQLIGLDFKEKINNLPVDFQKQFISLIPIRYVKKYLFFPITITETVITLAIVEFKYSLPYEDLAKCFHRKLEFVLSTESVILAAINHVYDRTSGSTQKAVEGLESNDDLKDLVNLSVEQTEDLLDAEDEEPIKKLVNSILFQSVKDGASDIHIDPTDKDSAIRYRIDGILHQVTSIPKQAHIPLVNRIKVMSGLDISTKNKTQDGRTMILLAGKNIDIRVSILPTVHGERAVMRLLNQNQAVLTLEQLGMSPFLQTTIDRLINMPHGIFLVTGATGSGKTTTLYASLSRLDETVKNIITIEDPVEIKVPGYGQVQINEKVGLTFAKGLRSILRQDPDVIMLGEIRDTETAEIAIQSALTGHFVFSTLHTNNAVSTIIRLIDMGIEPFLISSTLVGVLAQKLVRRICKFCKESYTVDASFLDKFNVSPQIIEKYQGQLWRGKGCDKCLHTGYQGRIGVFELLIMNDDLQNVIVHSAESNTLKKVALKNGLISLVDNCAEKVIQGLTTIEEMTRITHENSTEKE